MATKEPELVLVPATLQHVHLIASRMRKEDRAEVMASAGFRPAQAVRVCLRGSELARTVFVGGEVLAMFGVKAGDEVSIPWPLTTDAVERHPMAFWRASKAVLRELRALYPLMAQAIDARHVRAVSWARRLGFTVGDTIPYGKAGLPFHPVALGV